MKAYLLSTVVAFAAFPLLADDSTARKAGRAYGEFSRGVGEAIMAPMADSMPRHVIENVEPQPKDVCMKESNGVIDKKFMRCRNGAQLTWYVRSDGSRELVREKPLPVH